MYKANKLFKRFLNWLILNSPRGFVWRKKFGYVKEPKVVDILWTKVDTIGFIRVPIDILCAGILTQTGLQMKRLEETPHYQWIKDLIEDRNDSESRAKYHDYIKTFFPDNNTDYELSKIQKMTLSFKNEHRKDFDDVDIVVYLPKYDTRKKDYSIAINDGIHRVSIAKILDHRIIKCRLIMETLEY